MPKQVRMDLTPVSFLKGDLLQYRGREWTVVERTMRRVYASVVVEESVEPLELRVEQSYAIKRWKPTNKESYDTHLASIESEVSDMLLRADMLWEEALGRLRRSTNPKHFEFKDITEAHSQYYLAKLSERVLRKTLGSPDATLAEMVERCDDGDLFSVIETAVKQVSQEVWRGTDGRSGHLWAEAERQTDIDTKREWCDHWHMRLAPLQVFQDLMDAGEE